MIINENIIKYGYTIYSSILNNVNIDMNITKRLKELNDFKEILKGNIKNSKDYKNLMLEINR